MEEKKIQEEKESIPEIDQDKEPFQENEKVNSEEEIVGNEDKKTMEESTDENDKADDDTQSEAKENDTSEKVLSISALRKMFGKEVTWAAVAALGGAAIVIWSIIRYFLLLFSSYVLHSKTKVPIYLLMMRRNVGFIDSCVFHVTIITLCIIMNPYHLLNEKARTVITYIIKCIRVIMAILTGLIIGLIIIVILYRIITIDNGGDDLITFLDVVRLVFVPLLIPGIMIYIIFNFQNIIDLEPGKPILQTRVGLLLLLKTIFFIVIMSLLVVLESSTDEVLLDQDGRVIVADLGEQYIVQSAVYERDKNKLTIDNSRYYVVDSCNESVEVIRFVKGQSFFSWD